MTITSGTISGAECPALNEAAEDDRERPGQAKMPSGIAGGQRDPGHLGEPAVRLRWRQLQVQRAPHSVPFMRQQVQQGERALRRTRRAIITRRRTAGQAGRDINTLEVAGPHPGPDQRVPRTAQNAPLVTVLVLVVSAAVNSIAHFHTPSSVPG